jgi:hypothetical protein
MGIAYHPGLMGGADELRAAGAFGPIGKASAKGCAQRV